MSRRPATAARQREVCRGFEPSYVAERCLADAYARLVPLVVRRTVPEVRDAGGDGEAPPAPRSGEARRCS